MTSQNPPSDASWTLPWERRKHQRVEIDLPARLHGPRGEVPVRATNLSAGGVLLRVKESELCWASPVAGQSVMLAVVRMAFGSHLEVVFVERGVAMQARLVRMIATPDESDRLYLGCRFTAPLGPLHLKRLGVSTLLANEIDLPTVPEKSVSPRPDPLHVRARAEDATEAHGGGEGPLVEIGDHLLTMRVPYGDASALTGALGGKPVSLYVHDRDARVWAARGHLLSVRLVDMPAFVELGFLTSQDPRPVLGPRLTSPTPA